MQPLVDIAQSAVDLIWTIPMPWRALGLIVIGYGLLYAEYKLTGLVRHAIGQPLPGTGIVDFVLKWAIVFSFLALLWWGAAWAWQYAEPAVMASPAAPYVITARSWLNQLTDFVQAWQ